jgi:hypothetical protein
MFRAQQLAAYAAAEGFVCHLQLNLAKTCQHGITLVRKGLQLLLKGGSNPLRIASAQIGVVERLA